MKGTRLLSSLTGSESKLKGSNGVIRRRRKTTKRTKVKRRGGAAREGKREAAEIALEPHWFRVQTERIKRCNSQAKKDY
ncbi:BQ5605_C015g07747 [Microbotryum silenes-dioicae]|uniref:BQ5605_C015g07747 protein n=1 Tax=Microbotryum silenes-dioicae TaxID=796604 RepID=A0A2X0LXF6_9BASI|nr:BQ5605_C015g07747 [Microbotryum silenes-dioicae]